MLDKILLQKLLNDLDRLKSDFDILKKENSQLHKHIKILEEKLSKYENPKNSGNSSVPPSKDRNRTTKCLRKK